ncbi:Pycsar system effector family protein [Streptomyces litmocidini]|uniref:Pycsar system effector family protein n=1 Tax=Streptomyces litmocidini TaxID=67318 RepID=UPI0036FCAFF3
MAEESVNSSDGLALSQAILSETREELGKADQKANLLLAALGVATAAIIGAFASAKVNPLRFDVIAQCLFWSGCATVGFALVFLGMAVFPYLGHGKTGRMYYFGDVAANEGSEERVLALIRAASHTERNVQQVVVLAASVVRKYRRIRQGIFVSGVALVLLFTGTLLGVLR